MVGDKIRPLTCYANLKASPDVARIPFLTYNLPSQINSEETHANYQTVGLS